jgi:4-hydroxy-3-methylbut-2-en-1-yl diphosphate reductase
MKILLANPRGFCAGVNMAIEALDRAVDLFGTPLYVYHEIVHNKHVVDRFVRRGVVFVDQVEQVPRGSHLMYSAHGISPDVHRRAAARQLQIIDATCPLVRKVHWEAQRFARQGYTILLIGHRDHDEVVGELGEAPEQMILIETPADVDRVEVVDPARVAYLTQTTLSIDEVREIVDRIKTRFPLCVGSPKEDICYATQNRQEALKALLDTASAVVVVGSQNSSNSMRLAEIAGAAGKRAYLVDSAAELLLADFQADETVLITAGASAPEDLVQGCVELLKNHFGAAIEEHTTREEHVEFSLPVEVR